MKNYAFPKFRHAIGDLKRFQFVIKVLFEEGFSFVVDQMQLKYLIPLRSRVFVWLLNILSLSKKRGESLPPEVRLRKVLERLGPTYMKLGQLLSVRPDIMPPEYIKELTKLQDQGPTLRSGVAEKLIEHELGVSIENIFASFDTKPLAAASLAQVHRAALKDGTPVAVKVRRPGIEDVVKTDIHILAYLAQLLERYVPNMEKIRPVKVVSEFADWTLKEIDFEVEGAHLDMFSESFADMPEVVIPKVYWDYVSSAVLTMDLIEGVKIDDYETLDKAGVNRRELAMIGLRFGIHQFLIEGFFHGDPHPGNMVVLLPQDESEYTRLAFYDFGMVGRVSERHRMELLGCLLSFVEHNEDVYIKHLLNLSERSDTADFNKFENEVRTILAGLIHKPNNRKGFAHAFYKVLISGTKFNVLFPTDLILMAKSFATLEQTGFNLYPDINIEEDLRPFLLEVVREKLSIKTITTDLRSSAFDTLYLMKHLPEQTRTLLSRIDRGEMGVKLNLQELKDIKEEFDRQNDVRVVALLTSVMLVSSAILLRLDIKVRALGLPIGEMGFIAAFILVLWLFWLIKKKP